MSDQNWPPTTPDDDGEGSVPERAYPPEPEDVPPAPEPPAYTPSAPAGYTPSAPPAYTPPVPESYAPPAAGGYTPPAPTPPATPDLNLPPVPEYPSAPAAGGYTTPSTGGYAAPPTGGYTPPPTGGYTQPPAGGYAPPPAAPYPPTQGYPEPGPVSYGQQPAYPPTDPYQQPSYQVPPTQGGYPVAPAGPANLGGVPIVDWTKRALGGLIDYIAPGIVIGIVVSIVSNASTGLANVVSTVLGLAWMLFLGYKSGTTGVTFGRSIAKTKLVSEATGQPIGVTNGIIRQFAHIIDSIICYVGWLFPLWDAKRQTIADKLMKTLVVDNSADPNAGKFDWNVDLNQR